MSRSFSQINQFTARAGFPLFPMANGFHSPFLLFGLPPLVDDGDCGRNSHSVWLQLPLLKGRQSLQGIAHHHFGGYSRA